LNDLPRQKLREIVARYGPDVVGDARRCRALLLDFCGEHRREIFVLTSAQEEDVPATLQALPESLPLTVTVAQLTQRLVRNRALAEDAARWGVISWAWALGLPVDPTEQERARDAEPAKGVQPERAAPVRRTPKATEKRRGGLSGGVYSSNWAEVGVYGRPRSERSVVAGPEARWRLLGRTPGRVRVPLGDVVELRPNLGGADLEAFLSEVRGAREVVSLEVSGAVTDAGLVALRSLPALISLKIDHSQQITDAGMGHLAALAQLRSLSLTWLTRVTDCGFGRLGEILSLERLNLAWANVTDLGLMPLGRLSALSDLTLRECKRIQGNGLSHLKPLFRLTSLSLAGDSRVTDLGLTSVGVLTSLRRLNLSRCSGITAAGLDHLGALDNLTYLDLSWNSQLGDDALDVLRRFPNLLTLSLAHLPIGNGALVHLRPLRRLQHLDLSGCTGITDRGLRELRSLKELIYVNLTGCPRVTQRGIERLSRPGLYIACQGAAA
jgi:hypothetical protein